MAKAHRHRRVQRHRRQRRLNVNTPIGVFDSGIGGLSVLRALQKALPHERFVYLADNAHAPYGEKSEAFVRERTETIAAHLLAQHHIKALVVACNTATAAAIHELRALHPQLPLVGVEPALKPALALSRTGHIGVIATRGTVASDKFARLLASVQSEAHFVVQACNGLALAIEQSTLTDQAMAAQAQISHLLQELYRGHGPLWLQGLATSTPWCWVAPTMCLLKTICANCWGPVCNCSRQARPWHVKPSVCWPQLVC
jgi:glutamate racemase